MSIQSAGNRMSAQTAIRDRIERHMRKAKKLEVLLNALPENLPDEAEEALWDLVLSARQV